jgi:hypothetical protein
MDMITASQHSKGRARGGVSGACDGSTSAATNRVQRFLCAVSKQSTVASRQTRCRREGRRTSAACDGAAPSESIPAAAAAGAVTMSTVAAADAKAAGGGGSSLSSSMAGTCVQATQAGAWVSFTE